MPDTASGVDPSPGRRLRARREERGWSLSRLGRETHYSRGYLSRVENGVQRMTEDVAQACGRALEVEGELLAAVRDGLGREREPESERIPSADKALAGMGPVEGVVAQQVMVLAVVVVDGERVFRIEEPGRVRRRRGRLRCMQCLQWMPALVAAAVVVVAIRRRTEETSCHSP